MTRRKKLSAAIKAGILNCPRSLRTRETNSAAVGEVARLGYSDLFGPPLRGAEIVRVVCAVVPGIDPSTDVGRALTHVAAHPEAFCKWLERHPKLVRSVIRESQTPETAMPPDTTPVASLSSTIKQERGANPHANNTRTDRLAANPAAV